jgi:hypothetical protein
VNEHPESYPLDFFSNNLSPSPCDLTEASLEELCCQISRMPGKLTPNYNAITRFEIVGPYCLLPQEPHSRYIHTIYLSRDSPQPSYLTVLMAL